MNWNTKENQVLVQAILALKTTVETRLFLRDLLTEKEIAEFANRLKTAEMLINKVPYSEIKKRTGLSSTTIARVAKWLNSKGGGYRSVINKLHTHTFSHSRRGLS